MYAVEWEEHIFHLRHAGLCRSEAGDSLTYAGKLLKNLIEVADTYKYLFHSHHSILQPFWFSLVWKIDIPTNIILFNWLVWKNKNLTWENLCKQSWMGPGRCPLRKNSIENSSRLFFDCHVTSCVWYGIGSALNVSFRNFDIMIDCFLWWLHRGKNIKAIPFLTTREICCTRNRLIS